MGGAASSAASYVSDRANAGVNTAKDLANDPARAGRAAATGGLSEAWKQMGDPAKRKARNAEEAMNSARTAGYDTAFNYLDEMSGISDEAYDKSKTRLEDYINQRGSMNKTADLADATYADSLVASERQNRSRIEQLLNQSKEQAERADTTYTNSIQPPLRMRWKRLMKTPRKQCP